MSKPKHLGSWVVACSPQGDLIKWGQNGDTQFPCHPDEREVGEQLKYLNKSPLHKDDRLYVLRVFNNGQILTLEYDRERYFYPKK